MDDEFIFKAELLFTIIDFIDNPELAYGVIKFY